MKKTGHKPAYGQKGHTAVPERRSAAGSVQSSDRRIGTSVDWEIPGDVPEKERRSIYPYAPVVKLGVKWNNSRGSSARAGTTNRPAAERVPAPLKAHTSENPNRRSSLPILGLLALSLILGLSGLGYMHFTGVDNTPASATVEHIDVDENATMEDVPAVMQAVLSDVTGRQTMPEEQGIQPALADTTGEVADAAPESRIITHVVKKGDTLWDIAEHYVNDPFKYPEIAKLSEIENPDLIYPGEIVRIRV